MKHITILIATPLLFLLVACEDKKDDTDTTLTVVEVITNDMDDGAYYYNFTSAAEDSSTWHLSAQNIVVGNYYMPSIILDSTKLMVAVDTVNAFTDITTGPSSSSYSTSTGMVSYGGLNEILNYNFISHTVSTSTSTYFVYIIATHKVYKIFFEEYSDGVIKFNYADLTG
jgi:hypothetical protein|tara:strand:+ start:1605 stop:2114 length:510 start_codon:yes stop_codon:yes gene_type:complete